MQFNFGLTSYFPLPKQLANITEVLFHFFHNVAISAMERIRNNLKLQTEAPPDLPQSRSSPEISVLHGFCSSSAGLQVELCFFNLYSAFKEIYWPAGSVIL